MITVFLGGTCNGSTWRDELLQKLDTNRVEAFNPVVDDWTPECMEIEDMHKANDDLCVYVLTPEMTGPYSLFELGLDTGRNPEKTIFCFLDQQNGKSFTDDQLKGYNKIALDVINAGGYSFDNLDDLAKFLNTYTKTTRRMLQNNQDYLKNKKTVN